MNYKLSIIIPTFNAENYILKSVESVKNQTLGFDDIELILVDDNSNDSTKDIITSLSKEHKNIKALILKNNSGSASKPRNEGIKLVTSPYIMFLDADDVYDKDICKTLYESIENNDVDCGICKIEYITDKGSKKQQSFLDKYPNKHIFKSIKQNPEFLSLGVPTMNGNKIFKTTIIKENNLKFLESATFEDVEFNLNYYLNSEKILVLNDYYGYKYNRTRENNTSSSQEFNQKMLIKQVKGYLKIMETLKKQKIIYKFIKNELIVDMTKIYLYATIDESCEDKFLKMMKQYYKNYPITTRIHTAGLFFNIGINIFIKLFAKSNKIAIFTSKMFKKIRS